MVSFPTFYILVLTSLRDDLQSHAQMQRWEKKLIYMKSTLFVIFINSFQKRKILTYQNLKSLKADLKGLGSITVHCNQCCFNFRRDRLWLYFLLPNFELLFTINFFLWNYSYWTSWLRLQSYYGNFIFCILWICLILN